MPARLLFLDNLRYLLVLFVIIEHASHAYDGHSWWPVAEAQVSIAAWWLAAFSDSFAMPHLFFLAGYFALPSLIKKGAGSFIKRKLTRLGIPWLVCILTICPILPLIYHYTRCGLTLTQSYWKLWLRLMGNALDFDIGIVSSMQGLMQENLFYQRYMWFLSLLLLFFMAFILICRIRPKLLQAGAQMAQNADQRQASAIKLILKVGLMTFILSLLTIMTLLLTIPNLENPEPMITLGNLIQFRPSRFFMYAIYFVMGVIAYRKQWFNNDRFPVDPRAWMAPFMVLLAMLTLVLYQIKWGPEGLRGILGPVYILVMNLFCITALGFFCSLAKRYWSKPNTIDRSLAANSYSMYLTHYLFVILMQLLFLTIPGIPVTLKFFMVALSAGLAAYGTSRYIVTPFPKLSIAIAVALFAAMALFVDK
ncbi:MAG: acyltransferase family protein [Desulfarculaceae bacterium]|jgi:hypothetical protein